MIPSRLIILAIIAATVLGLGAVWVHDLKSKAYQAGREACQTEAATALAKANADNRKREVDLEKRANDFADRYERARADRRQAEGVVVERIETILPTTENCQIDPAVIALRNEVRAAQ